jgi:hypothetical protein
MGQSIRHHEGSTHDREDVDTQYGTRARGHMAGSGGPSLRRQGCATILSAHNASTMCYLHTQPAMRSPLARQ